MINEMTVEEAVKQIKENCYFASISEKTKQALDMAIKALKLQTCEDCISRKAVLDYAKDTCLDLDKYEDTEVFCDEIKAMPSVTPQYTDEEIDKIQAMEQAYVDKMVELAVAETKRPKGKWIEYKVDIAPHPLHCSLCGFSNHHISNRYMREFRRCPNCGAEMDGGGEDETSN